MQVMLFRKVQRIPVARIQKFTAFFSPASDINRSDGMDHIFCFQVITSGDLRLTGLTAVQLSALFEQSGTGCTVDRSVNAASAEQRIVRGIDDRINMQLCDVAHFEIYPVFRFVRFQNHPDQFLGQIERAAPGIEDDPCIVHVPAALQQLPDISGDR